MKIFLKKLHCYFYRFSVGFFYIVLWPFLYYFSRKPQRYNNMNKVRRIWGFLSSKIAGIIYSFSFEEPIDWHKTYIICPNHTSNLDITAMSLMTKNNFCFMGKEELKDEFVTGIFFRSVDIPVNRESKMSSYRAFKKAAEALTSGTSVIIFPEGRIPYEYPPQLNDFKNGPFRLAIELKIPIIPVSSTDTWKVLWDTGLDHGSKPGICNIYIHKPVQTAHLKLDDADALRDEIYGIINRKLVE
nr:lysophospholipid acyltransferase family protein [Mucilaginibacter sp.]